VPVVIVGNLYVGGVGKTPVVIALAQQLSALGWRPGVISRGYGVVLGSTARAGRGELDASTMGDEPALIGAMTNAPVCVHPNRRLACQTLLQAYPEVDVIVADDGLQHLALARDIEIIVQDERGVGNGYLLPAGPLREPSNRLFSANLVITRQAAPPQSEPPGAPTTVECAAKRVSKSGFAQTSVETPLEPARRPPARLHMWLRITSICSLDKKINLSVKDFIKFQQNKVTTAVAAISQPDRFFNSLEDAAISYQHSIGLPDHHCFDAAFFSAQPGELFVMTAKDAIKCQAVHDQRLWVVNTEAVFSDPDWATQIATQISRTR
jgi:tetraacyldisaccharide 4'-kinase